MDIRNQPFLTAAEVKALNFIKDTPDVCFRRHHRHGLRSHIFEILSSGDVEKETAGEVVNGTRWFPRAVPQRILRILRGRFDSLAQVLEEVEKYALILKYLGAEFIAVSQEFIVEYTVDGKGEILLCGLQEYVDGAVLDPWTLVDDGCLDIFYRTRFPGDEHGENASLHAVAAVELFVERTRKMIADTGYIPDLAGNGNLMLTPGGGIKLVDINNIVKLSQGDGVFLDDKEYPSCDKSVEVLAVLEEKVLQRKDLDKDPLYGFFMSGKRKEIVRKLEEKFYRELADA